jgi:hypothetical protein
MGQAAYGGTSTVLPLASAVAPLVLWEPTVGPRRMTKEQGNDR